MDNAFVEELVHVIEVCVSEKHFYLILLGEGISSHFSALRGCVNCQVLLEKLRDRSDYCRV